MIRFVCFDWGNTLMAEDGGPGAIPMALWPQVGVIDGAREVLEFLVSSYTICLATNATTSGPAEIGRALERGGLRSFVSRIFCFTEIGARKDSPRFWAAVMSTLGASAGEIAMVGDSFEHDVLGPMRCGIQAIWFDRREVGTAGTDVARPVDAAHGDAATRVEGHPSVSGLAVPTARHLLEVPRLLAFIGRTRTAG